jgi:hypothetical protein
MTLRKIAVWVLLMLSLFTAGCINNNSKTAEKNIPDINPNAETANKDKADVALYFSYRGEKLLAGETVTIDVPVSDSLEAAVVRALIAGPSVNRSELTGLFWSGVKLVGVDTNADYLFITLSEEFVSTGPEKVVLEEGSVADQKKLAICSIVNTLIEMGTYSRVQIYVDRQGGVGQRITLYEAGWEESSAYLEPLGRMRELILTPENTLIEALGSFAKKDWTRLYNFTAYANRDGSLKPDIETFAEALAEKGNVLESFSVTGSNVTSNGQSAVVMLDYSLKTREGDPISRSNIPVVLVREEDIWKFSYSSLVDVLINAG